MSSNDRTWRPAKMKDGTWAVVRNVDRSMIAACTSAEAAAKISAHHNESVKVGPFGRIVEEEVCKDLNEVQMTSKRGRIVMVINADLKISRIASVGVIRAEMLSIESFELSTAELVPR